MALRLSVMGFSSMIRDGGSASLETVKRYVEAQGTQEKPRKAAMRPQFLPVKV